MAPIRVAEELGNNGEHRLPLGKIKTDLLRNHPQDMILAYAFFQVKTCKEEVVLGRRLATHYGKNPMDIEFCHDCKFIRLN